MSLVATSDVLPTWVGTPPDGWQTKWLKWDVSLRTDRPSEEEAETLPYISNEDIAPWTGQLLKAELTPAHADGRKFSPDDVLFNKLRPYLAKVFHAPFKGISSGELLCLRSSESVLPRYLFYVVSSKAFVDAVNAETFGSKMPRADWEIVGHQPLPLPPFQTQKRIAAFLDEMTAQIDVLIAKKQALLEHLAEKRQAIITYVVTKGLNPAAPMKDSGIDWLGQIPAHWNVLPLRRLASRIVTGRTPPAAAGDFFTNGEVPWFTPRDFSNGLLLGPSEKYLTADAFTEGHIVRFPSNSVLLVGIGATLGKVAVAQVECSFNQQINAIKTLPENESRYLAYFLHGFRSEVRMTANGNTLAILNQDKTKALPVLRPPFAEQKAIATRLAEADIANDLVAGKIRESIALLVERRATLVTLAVTGKVEGLR